MFFQLSRDVFAYVIRIICRVIYDYGHVMLPLHCSERNKINNNKIYNNNKTNFYTKEFLSGKILSVAFLEND